MIPKGVQGAVRIARPFPNRHHPDFKKVMVLNILFGGFLDQGLMSNIREEGKDILTEYTAFLRTIFVKVPG